VCTQQELQYASLHNPSSNNNETLNSSSSSDVISSIPQLSDTFPAPPPRIYRPSRHTHIVSNCKSTRKVCSIKFYLKCHSIAIAPATPIRPHSRFELLSRKFCNENCCRQLRKEESMAVLAKF